MTRALVTGAGGFVGRQLVRSLVDREMQVSWFHHQRALRRDSPGTSVQCVIGDIRDMQAVDRANARTWIGCSTWRPPRPHARSLSRVR